MRCHYIASKDDMMSQINNNAQCLKKKAEWFYTKDRSDHVLINSRSQVFDSNSTETVNV